MLVHKISANISISSLMILVGIFTFCEVLVLFNIRISFFIFPMFTSSKWKNMLFAVFLNCKNAMVIFIFQYGFENWILIVFGISIFCLEFWNFTLLCYIWKKLFKLSAVLDSKVSFFSFSVRLFSFLVLPCQRVKV